MLNKIKTLMGYIAFLAIGLALGYAATHFREWTKPAYEAGNYTAFYPDQHIKVAVYGTSWCPFCAKTRLYLQQKQVAFSDIDVEKSPAAIEHYKQLGHTAYPVILIGDRLIEGFRPAQIDEALRQLH